MGVVVYILCALTSIICAILLLRAYRLTRNRLTFWSAICFGCLAVNNIFLILDMVVVENQDLSVFRTIPLLFGAIVMVYGTVLEAT
jgi:hypothetical protein